MKKFILFLLFFLTLSVASYSQKPMIGLDETTIIKLNKDLFGDEQDFKRDYTREYWILYTEYLGNLCVYYFRYGESKNFLFTIITDDVEYVKNVYNGIKKIHISITENTFYEKRTELYIKFTKDDDGTFVIIWSNELIQD